MERPAEETLYQVLCERHSSRIQEKLKTASVAVCGLGGLGSHIAVSLARIGVGHLHLIDFDRVELSNLNRQHYMIRHLGMEKTQALSSQIKEINPYLDIRTDTVKLTGGNAASFLGEDGIICEAFDAPESKAMLIDTVLSEFSTKKIVAASGMGGYGSSSQIVTRKVTKRFYLCGDGYSGIEQGNCLMAPRVLICAGHQANMILRLVLGEETV